MTDDVGFTGFFVSADGAFPGEVTFGSVLNGMIKNGIAFGMHGKLTTTGADGAVWKYYLGRWVVLRRATRKPQGRARYERRYRNGR